MGDTGVTITTGSDMTRIQVSCEHQNGLIYVVPAEGSWVCAGEHLPAHALAGFFGELAALQLPMVQNLMTQWGIYYRNLPRGSGEAAPGGDDPAR
jgi:hypothetical protein